MGYVPPKIPTLCWSCANATGNCEWSSEHNPVEGWTAEATTIYSDTKTAYPSYRVISCPEYIRDSKRVGTERL